MLPFLLLVLLVHGTRLCSTALKNDDATTTATLSFRTKLEGSYIADGQGRLYDLSAVRPDATLFDPKHYYYESEFATSVVSNLSGDKIPVAVHRGTYMGASILLGKDELGDIQYVRIRPANRSEPPIHFTATEEGNGTSFIAFPLQDVDYSGALGGHEDAIEAPHPHPLGGSRRRRRKQEPQQDRGRRTQDNFRYNRGDGGSDECAYFKAISMAVAFDAEFCQLHRSSNVAAQVAVQIIVAGGSEFYENDLCVKVRLTSIMADASCSTENSYYQTFTKESCGGDPNGYLREFSTFMKSNRAAFGVDSNSLVHLFTGAELPGRVSGCAWRPGLCNLDFGYGVLYQLANHPDPVAQALLFAHELGHNLNAQHDASTENQLPNYIMEPIKNDGSDGFSQRSIDAILGLLDDSGTTCDSTEVVPTVPPRVTPPPSSLPSASASMSPSVSPSFGPSESTSVQPSESFSLVPSISTSSSPSVSPSVPPSVLSSLDPTLESAGSSSLPSRSPTQVVSPVEPILKPSLLPTPNPTPDATITSSLSRNSPEDPSQSPNAPEPSPRPQPTPRPSFQRVLTPAIGLTRRPTSRAPIRSTCTYQSNDFCTSASPATATTAGNSHACVPMWNLATVQSGCRNAFTVRVTGCSVESISISSTLATAAGAVPLGLRRLRRQRRKKSEKQVKNGGDDDDDQKGTKGDGRSGNTGDDKNTTTGNLKKAGDDDDDDDDDGRASAVRFYASDCDVACIPVNEFICIPTKERRAVRISYEVLESSSGARMELSSLVSNYSNGNGTISSCIPPIAACVAAAAATVGDEQQQDQSMIPNGEGIFAALGMKERLSASWKGSE